MRGLLLYLPSPESIPQYLQACYVFNFLVATFCAILLFSIKTETSTKDHPWTKYLGIVLSLFSLQYLIKSCGIVALTQNIFPGSNRFIWAEFLSIPINVFLVLTTRTLLDKSNRLPRSFFILIGIDLTAIFLGVAYHVPIDESINWLPTSCRFAGDAITIFSLGYFAYASYVNTKLYGNYAIITLGIAVYAAIHAISPFIPNIANEFSQTNNEYLQNLIFTLLVFIAIPLKMILYYFAFLFTKLENQVLARLRSKLRESVKRRTAFFSGEGILDAIGQVYNAAEVKLYIKIPPEKKIEKENMVHVYSWPYETPSAYGCVSIDETPLPGLLKQMLKEQDPSPSIAAQEDSVKRFFNGLFPKDASHETRREFNGISAIRYHGGLIGCLQIVRKDSQEFTYSDKQICRVLSEEISVLAQFHRLQVSLKVLPEELDKKLERHFEKLNAKLKQRSDKSSTPSKEPILEKTGTEELNKIFKDVIEQVLSSSETQFVIDTGFVQSELHHDKDAFERANASENYMDVPYNCIADKVNGGLPIAHFSLKYPKDRDRLEKPSLCDFQAYREALESKVTQSFLSAIEQQLDQIISNLSQELTKRHTFDSWFEEIEEHVADAELDGLAVYHPESHSFQQSIKGNNPTGDKLIGKTLAKAFRELQEGLDEHGGLQPKVVSSAPSRLIVGIKLPESGAYLFVGIKRLQFEDEINRNTPWSRFLVDLASVADSARRRIMDALDIQDAQKDRHSVETAYRVGLFAHYLIHRINHLDSEIRYVRPEISNLNLDEALKKPIEDRIEEMKKEVGTLNALAARIRSITKIPHQSGHCFLLRAIREAVKPSQTNFEGKIEIDVSELSPALEVDLPVDIVVLIFDSLITNSIAAIKRYHNNGGRDIAMLDKQSVIKLWAKGAKEGESYIDCFIRDTGAGVDPIIRDRIFDINVSIGEGGWGLHMVEQILKKGGGSIELQHSEPGSTTFRLRLPKHS